MRSLIQIAVIFMVPFLFAELINRVKAIWSGRKGAPIMQALYDIIKLMKKGEVISRTTSFAFKISPSVTIASVVFAFLLLPIAGLGNTINFSGNFILFTYSLGLAKFLSIIAALDTGSSFEGMGSSREITFSSIVEPAFFIFLGTLALLTGMTSFELIFSILNNGAGYTILIKILFVVSLFIMILTEGSRVPVDDPNTHLELTMIHEVMILDYSGPDLAFIIYSSAMKLVLYSVLIADLLIPMELNTGYTVLFLTGILFCSAVSIGLVESLIARARMSHVPQFIFLMTAFLVIAFAVVLSFLRGGL